MRLQTIRKTMAGRLRDVCRKRVVLPLLGAVAASVMLSPITAYADSTPIVSGNNGTIAITYQDHNNDPIVDMHVQVYQVATVTGEIREGAASGYDVTYALTNAFRQFDENTGSTRITGFSEEKLNEALRINTNETAADRRARWQRIAGSLEPYVATRVVPAGDVLTGLDGIARFENLTPGLYLLIADSPIVEDGYDDYRYYYDPTFVALPAYRNGTWDYGIDLNYAENNLQLRPKYRYEKVPYEYEIFKRWVSDDASVRPESIIVDIYRDNELFETVELNEANGWHYRWTGGRRHVWRVVERTTAANYSVTVSSSKWTGTITLTNTYTPPPPENPPPNDPPPNTPPRYTPPPPEEVEEVLGTRRTTTTTLVGETAEVLGVRRRRGGEAVLGSRRLPQSGQLWWPVPVLAFSGVLLFTAGAAQRRKSREV